MKRRLEFMPSSKSGKKLQDLEKKWSQAVAFMPNLGEGSGRAETAISGYIFKGSALFDGFFEGAGSLAVQQVLSSSQRADGQREYFLERISRVLGKMIGL